MNHAPFSAASPSLITFIVLTKNNTDDLLATLGSISEAHQNYHCQYFNVLIVDGSCASINSSLHDYSFPIQYIYSPDISGIYNSMNHAISIACTEFIMFINSGDYLLSPVDHICLQFYDNKNLNGIASAAILFHEKTIIGLSPNPLINSFSNWLAIAKQLPCHQSMIFKLDWARLNSYPDECSVSADKFIKNKLIENNQLGFSPVVTVAFGLGGVSSNYNFRLFRKLLLENSLHSFSFYIIFFVKLLLPTKILVKILPIKYFLLSFF